MIRQSLFFLAFLLLLPATLVIAERSFSPAFQNCVQGNEKADNGGAAKENPPAFVVIVQTYVHCSSGFIERHAGGITALATIVIAAFTFTLWVATTSQAKATEAALVADKRAFVFAAGLMAFWEYDSKARHWNWRFRPNWQNSGDTPTRRLRIDTSCELRDTPLPVGFDFDTRTAPAPPGTGLLGPKYTNLGSLAPLPPSPAITPQDILAVQAGKKFLYLWGWARYFDVFPNTPEHITRFCWHLLPEGNPMEFIPGSRHPEKGSLDWRNAHATHGNCSDDECG